MERTAFGNYIPTVVYLAIDVPLLEKLFAFEFAISIKQTYLLGYAWSLFNVT